MTPEERIAFRDRVIDECLAAIDRAAEDPINQRPHPFVAHNCWTSVARLRSERPTPPDGIEYNDGLAREFSEMSKEKE